MIRLIYCSLLLSRFAVFALTEVEQGLMDRFFTPSIDCVEVSDWYNPTPADYWKLQKFMRQRLLNNLERYQANPDNGPFPTTFLNREFFGWLSYRSGRNAFVASEEEAPIRNVVHFNCDPNQKERCIICYAGRQSQGNSRDYIRGVTWIIKALEYFQFKGHFLYYIGGWPNIQQGRLKYADAPFSFKPFLFEEARNLGYQQILWLDACCIPVKNLDPVFAHIERNGLCFYSYGTQRQHPFREGYACLMPWLDIRNGRRYEEISSQVVGLDMRNAKASHLLDEWIQAAEKRIPFLQSDEPPFMFLVNELGMKDCRLPTSFYVETACNTGNFNYWELNKSAIIYHQYDFLENTYPVPHDLFHH